MNTGGSIDVVTFGCRLNAVESETMRARAEEAGLEDAILVNTCAVTGEAVRQARQAIRRARRRHPGRPIIVSGCGAQTEPETFAAMPEVDRVVGNEEKLSAGAYAPDFGIAASERVRVNDIMSVTETAGHLIDGLKDRARAFVQVQNGCDHRCTFCVIPYGRGNSRSVPMGDAVRQVKRLHEAGHNEIVLTGVDITAYGGDLPGRPGLGALVEAILKEVPRLPRLRLSSIDSVEADERLIGLIAGEERLMPHLHLSLQSGDDMILKRMKRRHGRDDALRFCERLRAARPDIVFGADLIAGFPTETEEMFQNTLDLVDACGITWLHVFPFSPRPGTPAARMPQLARSIIKERAALLRAKGEAARERHLEGLIGTRQRVLMEKPGLGRTEGFALATFQNDAEDGGAPGAIVETAIEGRDGDRLRATLAS